MQRFILSLIFFIQGTLWAGLQDDINAAASSGGTVMIPAGITLVNNTLSVPNNITLKGVSVSSVLQAANGLNGPVIANADQINGNTGLRLKGFSVNGNKINQIAGDGILLVNVSDIIIEDVRVYDSYGAGVRVNGASRDINIEACNFYSNGVVSGNGIVVGDNCFNISISNCTVYDNKTNGISSDGDNVRMLGNSIYNHTDGHGISLNDSNVVLVTCNRIEGAVGSGFAAANSVDSVVTGNYVSGAGRGFDVSASQDFIVNGNLALRNQDGIHIDGGETGNTGALISNNITSDNSSHGIYSYNYGNSILYANLALNSGTAGEDGYGIRIIGKADQNPDNLIINANEGIDTRNASENFQKYGLRLENLSELLLSDNMLINANTYDLSLGAGVTNLTENNNLADLVQLSPPANCNEVIQGGFRLAGDLNNNCRIDLSDIAILAADWLQCNNPLDIDCSANWPTN